MIGLVGKKVGMTRIFTEDGVSIPVTVIEVEANRVTQVKDLANDGYRAIQVTTGAKKANRVTKPEAGHFAPLKVKVSQVPLSAGTSVPRTLLTVTPCLTAFRVLSVRTRLRAKCSKARKWQVRWVTNV